MLLLPTTCWRVMMKKTLATVGTAVALSSAVLSLPANAYEAGDMLLRFGAAHVAPNESSSALRLDGAQVAGTKATVGDDTQFGISFTYMINQHVGVEVLGATPFKHKVSVKGLDNALSTPGVDGKLADVKHLPPTVSLQYYPMGSGSAWQPYVGLGLNHTFFFDEKLTSERKGQGFDNLKLKSSTGLTGQVGVDLALTERFFLNASAWYMGLDTTATVNGPSALNVQETKVKVKIDPMVYMLGMGVKF